MADIRLIRPRGSRAIFWMAGLALLALLIVGVSVFFGDPTADRNRKVGAGADFGSERAPVIPAVVTPFRELDELGERDLGRLVEIRGVAESAARANAVWVRADDRRRILVRIEPAPAEPLRISPGQRVRLSGYLQRIARAELQVWLNDSLGVYLPRPKPSVKFGDLPDSAFVRLDRLFVKNYYVSVRPEALGVEPADSAAAGR